MRGEWIFVLLLVIGFASASVEVNNYSIEDTYLSSEMISGEIDWTISGEPYDAVLSSNFDEEIFLGDFLEANGFDDFCNPADCSTRYVASDGKETKTFSLDSGETLYGGFYVEGDDVSITSLDFDLSSDFESSISVPLKINFFDLGEWEFSEFSDEDFLRISSTYSSDASQTQNPLIGVRYCERFYVPRTKYLQVGANLLGEGSAEADMVVYSDSGDSVWCNLGSREGENLCEVDAGTDLEYFEGDTYVCLEIEDATTLTLDSENRDDSSGWAQSISDDFEIPDNFTKDFDLILEVARHEDSTVLSEINWATEKVDGYYLKELAEDYISEKTAESMDCSDGCVLPFEITGINQLMVLGNLSFVYFSEVPIVETEIFSVDSDVAEVSFDGEADLGLTYFNVSSRESEFILYLDGKKLFEEAIEVEAAPEIFNVYPRMVPAGVPIGFLADLASDFNGSLSYSWDFGDNSTKDTTKNSVSHAYSEVGNYTLHLEVEDSSGVSSSWSGKISVVSPEEAIEETLASRRSSLASIKSDISSLPSWIQEDVKDLINLSYFEDALDEVDDMYNESVDDEDLAEAAEYLYGLQFPFDLYFGDSEVSSLVGNDGTDATLITQIDGSGSSGDYLSSVLSWQNKFVVGSYEANPFYLEDVYGQQTDILTLYSLNVASAYDGPAYLVVGAPSENVVSDGVSGLTTKNSFSYSVLGALATKNLDFYLEGEELVSIFVSPSLSDLVLISDIDTSCNYNGVCEEENGENSTTCRNDCKPYGMAIFYVILIIFFVLVIWTVLQIWYKNNYEKYLFGEDRNQIYNLLMFVSNARARGLSDDAIEKELKKQKWSWERIDYILRKSRGERTGMFEIIPLDRISAWIRDRKAKKNIATPVQQQPVGNINKSQVPRRF